MIYIMIMRCILNNFYYTYPNFIAGLPLSPYSPAARTSPRYSA